MAELVDALDSGSSRGNSVDVRVILAASQLVSPSCYFAAKLLETLLLAPFTAQQYKGLTFYRNVLRLKCHHCCSRHVYLEIILEIN